MCLLRQCNYIWNRKRFGPKLQIEWTGIYLTITQVKKLQASVFFKQEWQQFWGCAGRLMSKLAYLRRWKSVDKLFELSISGLKFSRRKSNAHFLSASASGSAAITKFPTSAGKHSQSVACPTFSASNTNCPRRECYFGVVLRASKGRN